jgi:hypothetical protein
LAYWALSHPFGVSGRSFRTQPEGVADSIPYPVFRKAPLLELGGYDEAMIRNQDNDMNYRLRRAGHSMYCTWRTSCEYQTRPGWRALMQYARQTGGWCGISFRRAPRSLGLRHYVPFLFVCAVLLGAAAAPLLWPVAPALAGLSLAPLPLHLLVGHGAALLLAARERDAAALLMPWVFLAFHLVYGASFAEAALRGKA